MKWFNVKAKAESGSKTAEIKIYSDIGGYGITAGAFVKEVSALGDVASIKVLINSVGGSVVDAIGIFNYLKYHKAQIIVQVDGVAASAASLIAMAGDDILMPENTMMMVHYPWADVQGNADEMRHVADSLEKLGMSMVNTYAKRTGLGFDELHAMLSKDTWLTAQECLEKGFCTKIIEPVKVNSTAHIENTSIPSEAKQQLYTQTQINEATDHNEVLGDGTEAEPFEEAPEVPQTDLDDDDDTLAKAQALAKEQALAYSKTVVELCALAGLPNKAAGFIGASTSLDEVRAQLLAAKANNHQPIDVAQPQAMQKSWAAMSLTEKSTLIRENPTLAKQLQTLE